MVASRKALVVRIASRATRRRLVRPSLAQHRREGLKENPEVAPERPRHHVSVIEVRHLFERNVAATEHLPKACDSGAKIKAAQRPLLDARCLVEDERTRANE